jgi:riboflavin transporter FmnP
VNRKYLPLVLTAILAAMSFVFELTLAFSYPPAPFLKLAPGDVPTIVATVLIGPFCGAACALVNSVLFAAVTGEGGPWGILMHFIASGGMAIVIGVLAKRTRNLVLPMVAGILTRVALMVPFNLLVTPIYLGVPRPTVLSMIVPVIVPFNLAHAGLNTVISSVVLRALPEKAVAGIRGRDLL